MNGTDLKNQLIFDFASGSLGPSKSIFASTYLYLNSKASNLNKTFENILGENLFDNDNVALPKLKYTDCISNKSVISQKPNQTSSPITKVVGSLDKIKWKKVFRGFSEFSLNINDENNLKLIKMEPGISGPLHSHDGKEFILVLNGSFHDEYGKYSKGDLQINDQNIKHTPIASEDEGCVCLTITEKDVIFFGRYGSFLNLFTFIKSFFK